MSTSSQPTPSLEKCNIGSGGDTAKFSPNPASDQITQTYPHGVGWYKGKAFFLRGFRPGHASAIVTQESRSRTQLSIIGEFITTQGDFAVLQLLGPPRFFNRLSSPPLRLWQVRRNAPKYWRKTPPIKKTPNIVCIGGEQTSLCSSK